jgi:hypothetical protein
MVRAATLPVTSESTHRLPSCSSCLFTFSIHSNNAQMFHAESHLHLPTHRSNTSRVHSPRHSATQRNTTRHDVTAASLPYLSYSRHLTTLLITPSLSSPSQTQHPHISHPSQTATPRTPSARLSTGNRQRGTVRPAAARERRGARSQTQRGSEAAMHQGFVARATIVMLTQIPDTKDGDQDRQFRRLRHTTYNDGTVWPWRTGRRQTRLCGAAEEEWQNSNETKRGEADRLCMHMQHAHAMQCNAVHPEFDPAAHVHVHARPVSTLLPRFAPCRGVMCCAAGHALPLPYVCVRVCVPRAEREERREGGKTRRRDRRRDGMGWGRWAG